jgi:2,5-diketo-D-gluconate reductase A
MDLGLAAIPKSSHPVRLSQNLDVFDFSLSTDDVAAISTLDQGDAAGADSDAFGH